MKPKLIAAEPVSAYDAKTHLPSLLQRTEAGARFVITRHGKPVAQLIPLDPTNNASAHQALAEITTLRAQLKRRGVTLASVMAPDKQLTDLTHFQHKF